MRYYINKHAQPTSSGGNYEIHKEICPYYYRYKTGNNFIYLGEFSSEFQALQYARKRFPKESLKIDGCAYCCKSIHRG